MIFFLRVVRLPHLIIKYGFVDSRSALDLNKCFIVKVEVPYEQELVVSSAGEAKWTVTPGFSRFPKTKMVNGEKQLVLTDRQGEEGIFVEKKAFGILWLMDVFKLKCVFSSLFRMDVRADVVDT